MVFTVREPYWPVSGRLGSRTFFHSSPGCLLFKTFSSIFGFWCPNGVKKESKMDSFLTAFWLQNLTFWDLGSQSGPMEPRRPRNAPRGCQNGAAGISKWRVWRENLTGNCRCVLLSEVTRNSATTGTSSSGNYAFSPRAFSWARWRLCAQRNWIYTCGRFHNCRTLL